MTRLTSSGLLILAVASLLIYLGLSALVPSGLLVETFNGIFLGITSAVTIVFFPLFIRAIKTKEFDRVSQLTIGIICTWSSLIMSRIASAYLHATGSVAISSSSIVAAAAYIAIIGGILHVTAPGMVEDKLKYNRGLLVFGGVVGMITAAITIYLQSR